jgi:hypothetical protein
MIIRIYHGSNVLSARGFTFPYTVVKGDKDPAGFQANGIKQCTDEYIGDNNS